MKKYLITLVGTFLLATTAVMAAPPQWSGQGNQQGQHQQDGHGNKHNDRDNRGDHGDHRDRDKHRDRNDRGGQYQYHYDRSRYVRDDRGVRDSRGRYYVVHDRGRHEGWYKRGGYVPVHYRQSRYYVTDWRSHRLYAPPRGYRWVRSDNSDFLLVAIATGVIANIILSH
ncbi:MAG: RcnB family protein [Rhodanobacter sp.]